MNILRTSIAYCATNADGPVNADKFIMPTNITCFDVDALCHSPTEL